MSANRYCNPKPRIIGVISSPRPNGSGAALVRAALSGAAAVGADTSEVFLAAHNIGFCQGCSSCLAEGKCRADDDFESIRQQLRGADGVILCSPVYGGAVNAVMKNFFDRLGMFEYMTSAVFGGKHVAAIATARRPAAARKVARQLAYLPSGGVFQRAYVAGCLGAQAAAAGAEVGQVSMQAAGELGRKMALDVRRGTTYPLQNLLHRLVAAKLVKPQFSAAIAAYREGIMRGVYNDLAGRGLLPNQT